MTDEESTQTDTPQDAVEPASVAALAQALAVGYTLEGHEGHYRLRAPQGAEDADLRGLAPRLEALWREPLEADLAQFHRDEPCPLSALQQRVWQTRQGRDQPFLELLLDGPLPPARLEAALDQLVAHHEILRTRFYAEGDELRQEVLPARGVQLVLVELAAPLPRDYAASLRPRWSGQEPLPQQPWQALLLRLAPDHHRLLLLLHPLIADGISTAIFAAQLAEALHQPLRHPSRPLSYTTHVRWFQHYWMGPRLTIELAFWQRQLALLGSDSALPVDKPTLALSPYREGRHRLSFDAELRGALAELARGAEQPLKFVLLGAWVALLSRYASAAELSVGVPCQIRDHADWHAAIGAFENPVVLRVNLADDPDFATLVERLLALAREVAPCGYAPIQEVAEQVLGAIHGDHFPLRGAFACYSLPAPIRRGELAIAVAQARFSSLGRDVTLIVQDHGAQLEAEICYHAGRYESDRIADLAASLKALLQALPEQRHCPVRQLPLLDAASRARVLAFATGPCPTAEPALDLAARFAAMAARQPDAIALRTVADPLMGNIGLEYAVLDDWASRIAGALRARGLRSGEPVGLFLHSSADAIAAMLGLVRAGATYVPLDPHCPGERLARMLAISGARRLITRTALRELLPDQGGGLELLFTDEGESLAGEPLSAPRPVPLELPAYIMFTSGSTGSPKGVAISQRAVLSLVDHLDWLELGPGSVVLQASSLAFDAATFEIWGALLSGATLVMPGEQQLDNLPSLIRRQGLTTLWLSSHLFRYMVEEHLESLAAVPQLLSGGDALSPLHVARYLEHSPGRLFNGYGPTESTTFATVCDLRARGLTPHSAPIGRPLCQRQVYVLDDQLQPVPPGVRGHIHIAGSGLAQGYLDSRGPTALRFLPNPFADARQPGSRLYRTGDLGRYLGDGHLEFLGRLDHQLKIQGVLVDPVEIAALLEHHPAVRQALVLPLPDSAGKTCLIAYVRTVESQEPSNRAALKRELHHFLAERLTSEVIPLAFVPLPQFPLTPSGKVDLAQLPVPLHGPPAPAPLDPVGRHLGALVAKLCGADYVPLPEGAAQLADQAHSPGRLIASLRQQLGTRFRDEDLAETSPAELAELLARTEEYPQAWDLRELDLDRPDSTPQLSREQRGLLDQLAQGGRGLQQAQQLGLQVNLFGQLALADLAARLAELGTHYEILRTVFAVDGPRVLAEPPGPPVLVDLSALERTERERRQSQLLAQAARAPFVLGQRPPWRLLVLRLGRAEHSLLLCAHQLVLDEASAAALARNLLDPPGAPLPAARPYRQYAAWQRDWLAGKHAAAHLRFWRERLSGTPALGHFGSELLPDPTDYRAADHLFHFPARLRLALVALSRQAGCPVSLVCQAAFAMLLGQYSGQQEFTIGWRIVNRIVPELEPIVGPLANILPVRVDLRGNPVFYQLLERFRHQVRDVRAHRAVPCAEILEQAQMAPCQAIYYWGKPLEPLQRPGLRVSSAWLPNGAALAELDLRLVETEQGLLGQLIYRTSVFDARTVQRFGAQLRTLLGQLVERADEKLDRLSPLEPQQRETLLRVWNRTSSDAPRDRSLARLFEDIVARVPHAEALRCPSASLAVHGGRFTYAQLNRLANACGRELTRLGIGLESPVLLALEPGPEAIVALLALLKLGATTLPIALEQGALPTWLPPAALLIAEPGLDTSAFPQPVLPATAVLRPNELAENPEDHIRPDHVACLYPRADGQAWCETHHSLSNAIWWYKAHLREGGSTLLVAHLDQRAALHELFAAFSRGGRLVVTSRRRLASWDGLMRTVRQEGVDRLFLPHPLFRRLAHSLHTGQDWPGARELVVYGQVPRPAAELALVRRVLPELAVSYRCDTADCTMLGICAAEEANGEAMPGYLPGRPLDNLRFYLLDRHMRPVPVGVVGRLYLGGAAVPRQRQSGPRSTAETLVPDPFGPQWESRLQGSRLIDTGTLAKFVPGENGVPQGLVVLGQRATVAGRSLYLDQIAAVFSQHASIWGARLLHDSADLEAELWVDDDQDHTLIAAAERLSHDRLPLNARPTKFSLRNVMDVRLND